LPGWPPKFPGQFHAAQRCELGTPAVRGLDTSILRINRLQRGNLSLEFSDCMLLQYLFCVDCQLASSGVKDTSKLVPETNIIRRGGAGPLNIFNAFDAEKPYASKSRSEASSVARNRVRHNNMDPLNVIWLS